MSDTPPGNKDIRSALTADWFENAFDPARMDPVHMAQKALKPVLPKRFYKDVATDDGRLLLDGRPARTPARNLLSVPNATAATALRAEWAGQGEFIDPATMPLTRLANSIIDGVLPDPAPVADDAARYAASDLLCYRAAEPARLVEAQNALWNPVLDWAKQRLGTAFRLAEGVGFVEQSDALLAAFRAAMPQDGWKVGAFHTVTTLTGSAILALALYDKAFDAETVWTAAHVDEDVQMAIWGQDADALERRAKRRAEFDAAVVLLD